MFALALVAWPATAAELTIYAFEGGNPASGLVVRVNGVEQGATADDGSLTTALPEGDRRLELVRDGVAVHALDLPAGAVESPLVLTVEAAPATAAGDATALDELQVTARKTRDRGSVAAAMAQQRSISEVAEVMGADQLLRAGDRDAAAAVQRVAGLTIEDDKYVVVRGQPARYALTLWNGAPLPSPDPSRQIVPLDLFPTSVLSRVAVQKSYSSDQPGSFGGGLVSLSSRAAPEELFFQVSLSTGGNTQATGRDGLQYRGGSGDIFGVDTGSRSLPAAITRATAGGSRSLDSLTQAERNELGKSFEPVYRLSSASLPPNSGLSFAGGSSFDAGGARLGALASVTWSNAYALTEERDLDYRLASGNALAVEKDYQRTRSDLHAQMAGLGILSAEWDDHQLASNTFFIRDTIDRAELNVGHNDVSDDRFERVSLLEFNQRELMIQQFTGEHGLGRFRIDWVAQLAEGTRSSPDRREYKYIRLDDGTFIFGSEFGMRRQFNDTSDDSTSLGVNVGVPIVNGDSPYTISLKGGANHWRQDRASNTQRFRFEAFGNPDELALPNPEDIINPDTIGTIVDFFDDTQGVDDYAGEAEIRGAYALLDANVLQTVRVVAGLRQEHARYRVRTFESKLAGSPQIAGEFDESRVLPAVSATWFMRDDMQVRTALSETVSRPLLIELSGTTYVDPDTSLEYVGNPDVEPAQIRSYDLRWEWYLSGSESLSVGAFMKDYTNPIEQQFLPLAGGGEQITFINGTSAEVAGVELGGRITLGRFAPGWLDAAYLQGNLTLIHSEVTLADSGIATHTQRPLQGQADTVLNLQFGRGLGQALHWLVSYNRVGERLETAGVNGEPDVMQQPLGRLDAAITWDATPALELKLTARNLLDGKREYLQGDRLERLVEPGISVAATVSYTFFKSPQ